MRGVFALQGGSDGDVSALTQSPSDYVVSRRVRFGAHVGDGLQDHAGNVHDSAVLHRLGNHGVHHNLLDLGDVAEGTRFLEETQNLTLSSGPSPCRSPTSSSATRPSQRSALEVGRIALPFSESLLDLGCAVAGRVVLVGHGKDVLRNGALVCLIEARQRERAGLEASRCGV